MSAALLCAMIHSLAHLTYIASLMLDITLENLIKVEEAADGVESLRRSLAPLRTLAKDAAILSRAAADCSADVPLFTAAQQPV